MISSTYLCVQRQRAAGPIHNNYIQIFAYNELVSHLRHPIRQRCVNEPVDNEFRRPFRIEICFLDALLIVGNKQLTFNRVIFRVQNETCVDHTTRQRK